MGLLDLKILLVVILCIPIVLLGIKLAGSLTDAALMGKKKSSRRKNKQESDD